MQDQRAGVQVLLVVLGLVGLAILLPVLLPVVMVLETRDRRRRERAAEAFGCVRCGQVLGRDGLERGDAAWREHFTALERADPYSKLRVVRDVWAVCPRCGARYGYDEAARTFRLLPEKRAAWFAPEEIDRLVRGLPVQEPLPFDPADDGSVRGFYGALTTRIEADLGLRSRVEWGHYGSGYASFVEAWFYPANGSAQLPTDAGEEHHAGLVVLFSRLSRYYVLGQDEKRWALNGSSGSSGLPCFEAVDAVDHRALRSLVAPVVALLRAAGLERLHKEDLAAPLPDTVQVPTILTNGPSREFDALFHWED